MSSVPVPSPASCSTPGAAGGGGARCGGGGRALWGLVALCLAVLWARTRSLDYLLPHLVEPDAYAVLQAEHFRLRSQGYDDPPANHFYFYPMLLARLQLALPAPRAADPGPNDDELAEHLAAAGAPVERTRWIVAVLSVLTVPATWLLARRFFGPWGSLLAAAWVGTSFLHLHLSGQARPHGMAVSWITLALASSLYLARAPSWPSYALAGTAHMLAICSLQNGGAVLLALVAAHLVRDRTRERGSRWKAFLPVLLVAAGVLFFYAFFIEAAPSGTQQSYTSASIEDGVLQYGGHRIDLGLFRGSGFGRLYRSMLWNDPVLLFASGLGLVALLAAAPRFRRRSPAGRDLLVIGAHAVPYFLVLGLYGRTVDRYVLPLLPCFALLATFGVIVSARLIARGPRLARARPILGAVLAVLCLVWPVRAGLHLVNLRGQSDTETQAAAWIDSHLDPARVRLVLGPGVVLPLFYTQPALEENRALRPRTRWLDYLAALPPEQRGTRRYDMHEELFLDTATRKQLSTTEGARRFVATLDTDYVVFEVSKRVRALGKNLFDHFRDAVQERGHLAVRYSPRPQLERNLRFLDYQSSPNMLERTLAASHLGPTMEIWRMEGAPRRR